jgi:hypothetical protein
MDATTAAWLEGIPPVRQNKVSRISLMPLFRIPRSAVIDFISCERNQLVSEDITMGFKKNSRKELVNPEIEKDIK